MRSVSPSLQHAFLGAEVGHRGVWAGRDSGGPIRTLHLDTLLIFWTLETGGGGVTILRCVEEPWRCGTWGHGQWARWGWVGVGLGDLGDLFQL